MTRDNQLNLPNFLTESILCCRPIVITLELGHMFLKVKLATERKNDKYYNTVIIWATIIMLYSSFQVFVMKYDITMDSLGHVTLVAIIWITILVPYL